MSAFPKPVLFGVFVLSGVSALIYQIVWQRSLLMIFGSNVESVAMVVAAFLMGLGIGSLAGGWISKHERMPLVLCFGITELCIGAYGIASLQLFHLVDQSVTLTGGWMTGVLAFALVFVPTLLMGSTLPMLVAQQVRADASVGEAVSSLYFVNTLGAALGAFFASAVVLKHFGLSGSVRFAAALNAIAALVILITAATRRKQA